MIGWLKTLNVNMPAQAFVLGGGGASRAVCFVLKKMGCAFRVVTRKPQKPEHIGWDELKQQETAHGSVLWVNTTPLGMAPTVDTCPSVPFDKIKAEDLVYDLVYNPAETLLLQRAGERGSAVKNGLEMLHLQAEAAWQIWND